MSRMVDCPKCGDSVDIRGLSGHLQMGHGLSSEEIESLSRSIKTDNDGPAESDTAPDSTGDRDAPAAGAARADGAGDGLSACRNCGSVDQVRTVRQMAAEAQQAGQQLKPAVAEHELFCGRCSIAFDGDSQ